jgi:hypothetical protein
MPKTGSSSLSFCKIAKQAADADLMQAEVTALKQLRAEGTNTHMHAFVPELLDTFVFQQTGKPKLQANVLTRLEGFCNLTEVHRVYAQGLHPLHVGWIWRRLLYVLGYSHQQEVVHGAVLPTPCHGFVGRLRRCFG